MDTFENLSNIPRIIYYGQPVTTTKILAKFYSCEEYQIKQNFRNNQERFIEEKHMFTLRGLALKEFKKYIANSQNSEIKNFNVADYSEVENFYLAENTQSIKIASNINVLYLWTRRGAARHAKMLNTDRAWEIFEILEDTYFDTSTKKYHTAAFTLAKEIKALASHTTDPVKRERLVAEAANLFYSEEIFVTAQNKQKILFKEN